MRFFLYFEFMKVQNRVVYDFPQAHRSKTAAVDARLAEASTQILAYYIIKE